MAQVFNDDFEELRMITNEDIYGLEAEQKENSKVSIHDQGSEQSDFRKLPQLDSFDSVNCDQRSSHRKSSKRQKAKTNALDGIPGNENSNKKRPKTATI